VSIRDARGLIWSIGVGDSQVHKDTNWSFGGAQVPVWSIRSSFRRHKEFGRALVMHIEDFETCKCSIK
jgi:hypothetical protein